MFLSLGYKALLRTHVVLAYSSVLLLEVGVFIGYLSYLPVIPKKLSNNASS